MKKAAITFLVFVFTAGAFAQSNEASTTIKVEGKAIAKAIPENILISIPVTAKDPSYQVCNDKITSIFNQLKAELKKKGIKEDVIKSDGLSVREETSWNAGKRELVGYIGSVRISIESTYTVDLLNDVMEVLGQERFNFGYQLSFKLSEEQKEALTEMAIKEAVSDAKSKANLLAEVSDMNIEQLVELSYDVEQNFTPSPILREATMAVDAGDAGSDVSLAPKEITVYKKVSTIWSASKK